MCLEVVGCGIRGIRGVSDGAHDFLKQAALINGKVTHSGLPSIHTVETADWAVTEEAHVLLHIEAFLGVFTYSVL
jgi:precorrin-6B methylase 1